MWYISQIPGRYGVSFVVKEQCKKYIQDFHEVSEHIALLDIKLLIDFAMENNLKIHSTIFKKAKTFCGYGPNLIEEQKMKYILL